MVRTDWDHGRVVHEDVACGNVRVSRRRHHAREWSERRVRLVMMTMIERDMERHGTQITFTKVCRWTDGHARKHAGTSVGGRCQPAI